jgi:hypothetical protein
VSLQKSALGTCSTHLCRLSVWSSSLELAVILYFIRRHHSSTNPRTLLDKDWIRTFEGSNSWTRRLMF